ncbi:MAG: adenosylcobinamide-GDP ribazoletransferase [Lachnospiraceae bacterium]|nr:adenosylcobinamide-GDP ribazoletransferase [Lachnospiraceae bacterium]
MKIIRSIFIAFAMYSRIPMPKTEWNTENMKYSIAFFPLVGVPIAALIYAWHMLAEHFGKIIPNTAEALVAFIIPIIISGGIHLDGFIDCSDALSSHLDKKRKLEIMADPHMGAFAIIKFISYACLFLAAYIIADNSRTEIGILALGFVLSRVLSAMGVAFFKCAKNDGLLFKFADNTALNVTKAIVSVEFILCETAMIHINPLGAFAALFLNAILFIYYYKMTAKEFGGITGDTCGWFSSCSELVTAWGAAIGLIITKGIMKI